MRSSLPFLTTLTAWFSCSLVANGYPMILEVPEETERCVRYTIPADDDAHVVFMALPGLAAEEDEENAGWTEEQKALEEHFIFQMNEMHKYRIRSTLPRKFPSQPPENIKNLMSKFLELLEGELKVGCKITITNPKTSASRSMETYWFTPVVINHIRRATQSKEDDNKVPLEGYEFCFENSSYDTPIQIIVETVLTSDPATDDEEDDAVAPVFESNSLTPLAEQLKESIESAHSVLKEMKFMESRERRMRQTADSINSRIRYFSYISVAVLIVVTFVQVSYLKRYFRKKKLL